MSSTVALPRYTARRVIAAAIVALIVLLLVFYGKHLKPRIWEINEMLRSDPVLAAYPYEFRVVNFLNGIATVTRPFTDTSGPTAFLVRTNPALAGLSPDDPAMRSAAEALGQHVSHARELLLAQPDIESVDWWLDQAWFSHNKVPLPPEAELPPGR